jgi:hypothetical protein
MMQAVIMGYIKLSGEAVMLLKTYIVAITLSKYVAMLYGT